MYLELAEVKDVKVDRMVKIECKVGKQQTLSNHMFNNDQYLDT